MSFLILTKAQADQIRGESSPENVLMPIELADGNFFLPARVLKDDAHASKHAMLKTFPQQSTVTPKVVAEE